MPAYDFRCKECKRIFTLTAARITDVDTLSPACPKCGSTQVSRLIRRVGILTSEDTRLERLADPSRLSGLDEEDPRAIGRFMREMSNEMGEDAGPEMEEMIERLESGESPESIEQSLGADSDFDSGAGDTLAGL